MNESTSRAIIGKITANAIALAHMRHGFHDDEGELFDDERVAHIKEDIVDCMTGDDSGCLDEDELNTENCERLWLETLEVGLDVSDDELRTLMSILTVDLQHRTLTDKAAFRSREILIEKVHGEYRRRYRMLTEQRSQ